MDVHDSQFCGKEHEPLLTVTIIKGQYKLSNKCL